jgi:hypothetical protein
MSDVVIERGLTNSDVLRLLEGAKESMRSSPMRAAGTFGLRSPKSIGRYLNGAERVTFGARLGHAGRQMTENREQSKESPLPLALQTRLCEELPCAACTPDRGNAVIDSAIVFGWSFEAGTVLMPPHVAKFLAHIGK